MHSQHGGQLRHAAEQYQIPLKNWVDLSTGINPNGYPIPDIPADCWQRLPEDNDGLLAAAYQYYQADSLLAIAGSQAAIQTLPYCFPRSNVGVLTPSYYEHKACWQRAGHQIIPLSPEIIDQTLSQLNILIIVNPNNPTAQLFSKQQLLDWHKTLHAKNGVLMVDEAFIETSPENSLSPCAPRKGLIILRSIGKFFGLAGVRCGFILAEPRFLQQLELRLGIWSISHPSRYIVTQALNDFVWQQQTLLSLPQQSHALQQLLEKQNVKVTGNHALFQWIKTDRAKKIHHQLAQHGIFTRLFDQPQSLRFGLPKNKAQSLQLAFALSKITP
ncbi:MAG: threonine-phosphate decarboxylase [Methylococcales bacterium]|nr:threonine-phosphate decarboxylase [Methylococcales bacterium]